MSDLRWRIQKKEEEILDKQSELATRIDRFGHPNKKHTRSHTTAPAVHAETRKLLDDVRIQRNTLRSLYLINCGFQPFEI